MSDPQGYREGNRAYDPADACPGCKVSGNCIALDFKKLGTHSVRACLACKAVYHNGEKTGPLSVPLPNVT